MRNHKKKHENGILKQQKTWYRGSQKSPDVALVFRCLGLQKSSSRVGAVTICEMVLKNKVRFYINFGLRFW